MDKTTQIVTGILADVRRRGDAALCEAARRFDGIRLKPSDLLVGPAELKAAASNVSSDFKEALKVCGGQIEAFAKAEKKRMSKSWLTRRGSMRVGQLVRPVDSVGLYIPGGRFPYPSTVLMTAIPA